jgi:thiamine kinase-like enzyme
MQQSRDLQMVLPQVVSEKYDYVGVTALERLEKKWLRYRSFVPSVADEIESVMLRLKNEIKKLTGAGLVASHHDICNANWLITPAGKIYLVDLEAMTRDDPAHDLGSLLWWYYPPELRAEFLSIIGYSYDADFKHRMQVRMTMHCLDILLPRPNSYDRFDADLFLKHLGDFRAVSQGKQNPHGYVDLGT